MQHFFDSIVLEALPVLVIFLCGFAGWAGARSLKRRLHHRLESRGLAHKKIDDEPEVHPAASTKTAEPRSARPPAGPSPMERRPTALKRRARRCPQEESQDQPTVALASPGCHSCPTVPGQLAEPVEQATPTLEQAEVVPESDRVTRLLAKKAARKARKALERQEAAEAEPEWPPAATERQEATEATEAEWEQPPAVLDRQEVAEAAETAEAEPDQPAAALAGPACRSCPTVPGQPVEPAEQVTPMPELAEVVPESARVTRLLAKKAARKARKALEREETAEAEPEQPSAATERQEATEATEAEREQPAAVLDRQEVAKAAEAAEAEREQSRSVLDQQEVAEAAEAEREQLPAVADEGHSTRGAAGEAELVEGGIAAEEHLQDHGAEPARMLWATQEIEQGEWKDHRSLIRDKRSMNAEPLLAGPPRVRAGDPEYDCYTQHYRNDNGGSRWSSSWQNKQRSGSWGYSPGRQQGFSRRGEAGPALQELDSWMTPFDALSSKPAPPVPLLLQQPAQAPVQAPILGPVGFPGGHVAFCDSSGVYSPVGGGCSGVFVQMELPLQDPDAAPGPGSGILNGLQPGQDDEFDPYDPAGLAPPNHQEQQWKSHRAGRSTSWGSQRPKGSWSSNWDPSW